MTQPQLRIAMVLTSKAMGGMEMRSVRIAKYFAAQGYDMHYGSPPESKIEASLADSGVKPFNCHIHGSADIVTCLKLAGYLKKEKIQLLMAFSGTDYWACIVAAKLNRIPVVLSRSTATPLNPLTAWFSRNASRMVTVARSIKTQLVLQGMDREKIEIIYNGIDVDKFSGADLPDQRILRQQLGLPEDKFIAGCLGRAEKGQTLLMALDDRVRAKCPELHYFFAGQRIPEHLGRFVQEHGHLNGNVTLQESIPYDQVPAALHALDAVIMLPETEPFSNAVIEAMAMEKPMILSRSFGNVEAVEENVSGILVDYKNEQAIVSALVALHKSAERRAALGRAARKRAVAYFSQEAMMDAYQSLWHRLADPQPL